MSKGPRPDMHQAHTQVHALMHAPHIHMRPTPHLKACRMASTTRMGKRPQFAESPAYPPPRRFNVGPVILMSHFVFSASKAGEKGFSAAGCTQAFASCLLKHKHS